jgi:hypothetical protein
MRQWTPDFWLADGGYRSTIYRDTPNAADQSTLRWVTSGQFYHYDQTTNFQL